MNFKEVWFKVREPLLKALIEGLRLAVIGVLPFILEWVGGIEIPVEIKGLIIVGIRTLDKYLHNFGKENEVDWMIKGLLRF